MRRRLVSRVAALVVLCNACAPGSALRVEAERHAPIAPRHAARRLEPSVGYMLVNPLVCLEGAPRGGSGEGAGLLALLVVGCAGVLGAVDLVALPVQALRRSGQWRELEVIGRFCPLEDPAPRVATHLAGRMAGEFGFAPMPTSAPGAETAGTEGRADAHDAVILSVRTASFERSSKVAWKGMLEFRGSRDELLWHWPCESRTQSRAAKTFAEECEAARKEVAALADDCIESAVARLHELWPRWDPARTARWRPAARADDLPDGR